MGYSSNWNGLVVIPKRVLFARDQPNVWPLGSDADKAITRTWEQGLDTESLPDPSGPLGVGLSPPQQGERQRQRLG